MILKLNFLNQWKQAIFYSLFIALLSASLTSCFKEPFGQHHGQNYFELVPGIMIYDSPIISLDQDTLLVASNEPKYFETGHPSSFSYTLFDTNTYKSHSLVIDDIKFIPIDAQKLSNGNVLLFGNDFIKLLQPKNSSLTLLPFPLYGQRTIYGLLNDTILINDNNVLLIYENTETNQYETYLYNYKINSVKKITMFPLAAKNIDCVKTIPLKNKKMLSYALSPLSKTSSTLTYSVFDDKIRILNQNKIKVPFSFDSKYECPLTATLNNNNEIIIVSKNHKSFVLSFDKNKMRRVPNTHYSGLSTITALNNDNMLLTGGAISSFLIKGRCDNYYIGSEIYHPSSNTFTKASNLNKSRMGHHVIQMDKNKALIMGGKDLSDCDSGQPLEFRSSDWEIFHFND